MVLDPFQFVAAGFVLTILLPAIITAIADAIVGRRKS